MRFVSAQFFHFCNSFLQGCHFSAKIERGLGESGGLTRLTPANPPHPRSSASNSVLNSYKSYSICFLSLYWRKIFAVNAAGNRSAAISRFVLAQIFCGHYIAAIFPVCIGAIFLVCGDCSPLFDFAASKSKAVTSYRTPK